MEDIRRDRDRELYTEDLAAGAEPAERERRTRPRPYEEAPMETERGREPLFVPEETESFRSEWADIQIGFVDQPREAVEKATRSWPV